MVIHFLLRLASGLIRNRTPSAWRYFSPPVQLISDGTVLGLTILAVCGALVDARNPPSFCHSVLPLPISGKPLHPPPATGRISTADFASLSTQSRAEAKLITLVRPPTASALQSWLSGQTGRIGDDLRVVSCPRNQLACTIPSSLHVSTPSEYHRPSRLLRHHPLILSPLA